MPLDMLTERHNFSGIGSSKPLVQQTYEYQGIIIFFGSLSSPGDGIVRITLLTRVKKERKER